MSDGKQLSSGARAMVATMVGEHLTELGRLTAAFGRIGAGIHGDKAWRRDCLTPEQRKALSKATKRLRAAAKAWAK